MAHKENKSVRAPIIRHTRLDDASQVCEVNRSHVERWYRKIDAEQYEVPYGSLSLSERWGFGGPWMSVETCSVHLNNLLLKHHLPIVAEQGGKILGEMELFLGKEDPLYGNNLHIGLLYVRKNHTGHGIGKALAEKAFTLAAGHGCDTVTVASSQANEGFYENCGFERSETMVEVEAATGHYDVSVKPLKAPHGMQPFAHGKSMVIGRYQSSAFHLFELHDAYAIPEFLNCSRETVFAEIEGRPAMFSFIKYDVMPQRAEVYAWADGAKPEDVISAALELLYDGHVGYATLLLTKKNYEAMADKMNAAIKGSRVSLIRRL